MATWSDARQTYGQGTPPAGKQFDKSGQLTGMQSTTQSAAPGSKWTGTAANAYGTVNTQHGENLGQLAKLDQRLAAEVDNSAQSTVEGRQRLDALRKWVADAEANIPAGKSGDQMRMVIAQKGLKQLQEILHQSNSEFNAIGDRIRKLSGEYQAVGDKVFKQGGGDVQTLTDEEKKKAEEDAKKRAHDDVQKSIKDGDKDAAARVEKVLKDIKPYQEMTPEQAAYLNEMQSQQHGMSVKDLKDAEGRLGDKGHIIGDSWQLMSNDDVPRDAGKFDDQKKGGFDRLPQSVQDAVKSGGIESYQEVKDIAAIVKDGNPDLQQGTEIDRELMRKADRIMDDPQWDGDLTPDQDPTKITPNVYDGEVRDIFDSAGRDHQIVHDMVTGNHGDDGQDFLHDVNHHAWADKGTSAGHLFSWTENPSAADAQIAGETAQTYGTYIGEKSGELMNLPGHHTLGEFNPELTRAYAHGLGNYIPDIADLTTNNANNYFEAPDGGDPEMKVAKGIFSVLSTDKDASDWFNGKADAAALAAQTQYSDAVKNHAPNLEQYNGKLLDATVLKGLVEVGTVNAAHHSGLNGHEQAVQAYERQKSAFSFGVDASAKIANFIPEVGPVLSEGISRIAPGLEQSFIGPPPGDGAPAPTVPAMGFGEAAQVALDPLLAAGVPVTGVPQNYLVPIEPGHPEHGMRIGSVQEIKAINHVTLSPNTWHTTLTNAATYTVGPVADPVEEISQRYEQITKNPEPA